MGDKLAKIQKTVRTGRMRVSNSGRGLQLSSSSALKTLCLSSPISEFQNTSSLLGEYEQCIKAALVLFYYPCRGTRAIILERK